jgi:hypothetical protein
VFVLHQKGLEIKFTNVLLTNAKCFTNKIVVMCLNVLPSVFRKVCKKFPVLRVCAVKWIGFSLQLKVLDVPNILYEEECWIDTKKRFAQLKSRPVGQ